MDNRAPQTTVVIPVWDDYVGERLNQAIASVQEQDVEARIVVVDNASRAVLPLLNGVTVVRAPARLSLGAARNLGLECVETPNVVVWDADDIMLPGTLSLLERGIESRPRLAAFGMAIVEESGARHRWPRRWVGRLVDFPAAFAVIHCIWSLLPTTGSTIMRTDAVRAGGGYSDAESGDDWVAGVSLAFRGEIGWSERPGRIYRIHDQSIWARHMSVPHQVRHARAVRQRIRRDSGIPAWVKGPVLLIGLGQYAAIAAHAIVAASRRAGAADRGRGR
jgi:glycosyltransferase involved in cell wall biosynthesis